MPSLSKLQRQFDRGELVLPDDRPASLSERAWIVLVRHVRERVPYRALAAEFHISPGPIRHLATQAARVVQYPEWVDLPSALRRVLVVGGYTTRAAVARASDAELLALNGMGEARLRQLRSSIPRVQ